MSAERCRRDARAEELGHAAATMGNVGDDERKSKGVRVVSKLIDN
jgi:hypothetical protein